MDSPLDVARSGAVETWTINQPDLGNTVSDQAVVTAFDTAVDTVNADTTVRAVILTGAGTLFSAGGNVTEMADRVGVFALDALDQRRAYIDGVQRIPRAVRRLEVPLIAAVNGAAVGAGCDLAAMCDIRIASERAYFAESFVRLGLVPGDGGSWFLPRAVGFERAAEMTFTGDRIDAATALAWGLVGRVVAHEELMTAAHALAERIAANPSHALRLGKRLLQVSYSGSLDSVLDLAAAMQPLVQRDPEHERRIARWRTS